MRRVGLVIAFVVVAGAGRAHADVGSSFAIERFRLAMDDAGILDVDWADVPGHATWGLGLWVGFAHDPLVAYDSSMASIGAPVGKRVTSGLVGSVGLWDRFELGGELDVVDYQSGSSTLAMTDGLPAGGAGDLRVAFKIRLARGHGFYAAIVPAATVPLGSAGGYLREGGPTFAPELALAATAGNVRVAGNLGYRTRERTNVSGLVIDDEVFGRAGAGVHGVFGGVIDELDLSVSLAAPIHSLARNVVAAEAIVSASRRVTGSISMFAGAGLGLDNGFGTPDWRALVGVRVGAEHAARSEPDRDGDGIPDALDKCPADAEDKDGFADDDGCPDPDNDNDGIADAEDKCPNQPEDKDGVADDDGCPDANSKLEGRVVDVDGRPIAGVHVTVRERDLKPVDITPNERGELAVEVAGGPIEVTAEAPEYAPAKTQVAVTPGETAKFVVTLKRVVRQGQLKGQVLSFDGKPVVASISVTGTDTKTTSDADGFYAVELPEGSFEIVIEADHHVTQRRTVSVKLERVTVLNVDLRATK